MKKTLCTILTFISFNLYAQEGRMETAIHAIGGIGMDAEFTPAMQLGTAANINRVYLATALTLSGNRNNPAMVDFRAGYITGKAVRFVPYMGYSWQPASYDLAKGEKRPSELAPSYGLVLTYPLLDSKSSVYLNFHSNTAGGPSALTMILGIKMRLSRIYCE